MYGHGHPYYAPPPPPPPPPRPTGLSPLAIAFIVIGGVAVLGGGACVVLGGLVYLGAKAEAEAEGPVADPSLAPGVSTANPSASSTDEPPPLPVLPPELADDGTDDNGAGDGDDESSALADPSSDKGTSSGSGTPSTPKTSGGTKWSCNATGWVRVCGFANVCNNQMVSGIGLGNDRFSASMMAKNACENMARAKGGSTVCMVSCSPR